MKSKFAKFVDATLGSALIFLAAFAVMRYFAPARVSVVTASATTLTALLVMSIRDKKKSSEANLGAAAGSMFYEFMFLSETAPLKYLKAGLERRGVVSVIRGKGLYANGTAVYTAFSAPPDETALARAVARAEHYGCKRAVVLCRALPLKSLDTDFELSVVAGDDVYRLFASLGALPEKKHLPVHGKRRRFAGAIGKDRIPRYALLSAALFALAAFTGFPVIPTACATVCAALFLSSVIATSLRFAKK